MSANTNARNENNRKNRQHDQLLGGEGETKAHNRSFNTPKTYPSIQLIFQLKVPKIMVHSVGCCFFSLSFV